MNDTEGVSFPGARPITEPTIVALPGGGPPIVFSGVCEPPRNGPKVERKKTTQKAKQGKKKAKKGASKKKK